MNKVKITIEVEAKDGELYIDMEQHQGELDPEELVQLLQFVIKSINTNHIE
jgi:hypothetical protein